MNKFGKFVCKYRVAIIIVALLLLIPSAIGMVATRINYDILTYLPDDVATIQGQNILSEQFNMGSFAVLIVDDDMRAKDILSMEDKIRIGKQIGADVPYCIMRGTALAEGIGEKLSKLPPMVKCPVLIAKPQISVSTKFVYENLKLGSDMVHPDIDRLVADIREKDLYKIATDMGNVLETVTIPAYPVIADIKDHMMEHGAVNAMMSGSGPTVFGLFDKEATAVEAYEAMKASGLAKQVYLTSIYNNARK